MANEPAAADERHADAKRDRIYILNEERVAIWMHAHTHHSFDYDIQGTRTVCNPRDYYPFEPNEAFRPDLVLEI